SGCVPQPWPMTPVGSELFPTEPARTRHDGQTRVLRPPRKGPTVPLSSSTKPITEDDELIRAALEDAHVPSLLPALAHLTGDLSLLRDELRPDPSRIREAQG